MSFLYLYLLKVALINALMLGFYHFAIRPGRNLRLMRGVLLLSILLPLFLPLIPQPVIDNEQAALPVYVFAVPEVTASVVVSPGEEPGLLALLQNALYPAIVGVLMLGLLVSVGAIFRKLLVAARKSTPFGEVFIDNKARSPYSFFRWVFFSDESLHHPAALFLLRHEFSHVRHGHSIDRLLSATFRALFWFSPFAHLNNRLLAEVHEFQADADATVALGDKSGYGRLMLTFAGLPGQNPIINPFSAHLKKRIIMLNQIKKGKLSILRLFAGVTIIMAVVLLSSMIRPEKSEKKISFKQTEKKSEKDISNIKMKIVYDSPEEKIDAGAIGKLSTIPPSFPGGDEARIKFFRDNISYPTIAREKNIQGTVYFRVIIDEEGKVTNPSIEKGIGGGCDEEVLRVVKMMPDWNPGNVNGKPVSVEMMIPVSFTLSDTKTDQLKDDKAFFYRVPEEKVNDQPAIQNDPAKKNNSNSGEVFTVVENPPQYTGGQDAMIEYLKEKIRYPEVARKNKKEGTVYVSFVVETDGQVSNVKILRGIGSGCDEVAMKAVQDMPPWVPGTQRGKAVRVQYNLPIKFTLTEGEKHSVYSVPEQKSDDNNEVFVVVEQPPVFPGGDEARVAYVVNNISYPAEAKSKGIQGTVYVTFVIEQDGTVSNVKVLRGVHAALDKEAVRVIQTMPAWTPGKQRGNPVRVQFNMPVKFSLSKDKSK
ncbi:MAG: M56 family metallopeptidase [Bacteroidales bacterium]|nr:M56 family metallopeptidase [Bacteroidales bacterium]